MSLTILVFAAVLLVFSSMGIGGFAASRLSLGNQRRSLVISFFLGEIFLSFVWVLFSIFFTAPYNVIVIMPVLLVGTVFFFEKNKPKLFEFPYLKTKTEKFFSYALISIIFFYFINSLIPPFDWDVISYHLPVIKELSSGSVNFPLLQSNNYLNFFSPFSFFFGNLPYSSESYASILYSLSGNASSPHLLYLINFIFFLYIVNDFLMIFLKSNRVANLSVAILISLSHGITLVISTGLIDTNLLIYQFLTYFSALMVNYKSKYIYLFFAFGSYAIGQKYTSLFILLPAFIYVFISYIKNKEIQKTVGRVLPFILKTVVIFFISGGFWYFKNIFLHGNPVYPLYLGHRGMTDDMYKLLMDNLIYELRSGHSFIDLIKLIKINYANETGIVMSVFILIASYLFRRVKLTKVSVFLIISLLWIYLVNFYLGSQLSRFVLIVPIFIYILFTQILEKNRYLAIIVVLITIFGIRFNSLQWSTWNSRIHNTVLFLNFKSDDLYSKNIGCSFDTYKYLKSKSTSAFNFWDPYPTSYFDTDNFFVNIPRDNKFEMLEYPNVDYVYINNQYRLSFVNTKEVHRDIDINGRLTLEEKLINGMEPEFKKDNCYLYRINMN